MKAIMFYRPNSEHATRVESFLRDFLHRTGKELPVVDIDTPDGIAKCRLYNVMSYPAIIATDNDGRELQRWDGELLPQISEVSYYLQD